MKQKTGLDLVIIASSNDLGRLPNTIKHIPNVDNIYILENQKSDNDEITLVHSNGHIHHYLWSYSDEHFHFAKARNHAVALSNNEWIIWLDSDDALHPDDCEWINNNLGTFDDTVGGVMFGCSGLAHFEDIPLSELADVEGINIDNWGYWSSPTIRIIRQKIAKWKGRIHEQVLDSINAANKNLIISDLMVKHRGYCTTLETYISKMRRNKSLLEIQLDESTDYEDIYISYLENTNKSLEQLLALQEKKKGEK
jgi:glycosyltransferase involved in cell wall biosynthesis